MTTDMLNYENEMRQKGYRLICGIDEAGRGPLAGPVFAAAVIFPPDIWIEGLNDSKQLSPKKKGTAVRCYPGKSSCLRYCAGG